MNSAEDIWQSVLDILKDELTQVAINTWFSECTAVSLTDTELVLTTPSDFKRNILNTRFKDNIEAALKDIFSGEFHVNIMTEKEMAAIEEAEEKKPDTGDSLSDVNSYTFQNFVVGSSNKFAHAAAMAVAEEQTKNFNPLFIYGDSGLGKTHLLYAIRNEIKRRHPDYRIVFVRGGDFMNELITAIQTGKNLEFREKYRSADLFLVDDIQVIAGKTSTEEEIFHTFNTLYEAQKQIVFTSDRPPSEMTLLADRLKTRFESGLIADIQAPDYETRIAIIRNKSLQLGMILPDDVMAYIAENMTANVRQLEGAVKKIRAEHDLTGDEITVQSVTKTIKGMFKEKTSYVPTPDDIIDETAKYYGLTAADLKGKSRTRNTALARQIAMYQIRRLTNLSLNDVGDIFDGRDHSTVISSIQKIEDMLSSSESFARTVRDITANINARG